MTEKTLTTENIKPALDALRGELAPWPVVAMKQDRLNDTQKSAVNSGITSSLVAQIIANTAAIRALESAITGTGLRPLVVASLPAIGTQGILYIVPVITYDPETDADVVNYSNEYIWIVAPDAPVTEGYYEQVGQTGIVINNGQLTITVNGTSVGTFTANQSGDTTAAITVPTNADYVDKTTAQTAAGVKTFSDGIVSNVTGNVTGDLTGTASKAIADEDGTSIKTGYGKLAGNQTWTGENQWGTNLLTVKDSAFTKGTTVTDRKQNLCKFTDSNDSVFGIWEAIQYTSGRQGIRLNLTNKYKNGALDPTGNDVPVYFEFLQKASDGQTIFKWANGLIDNGIYPVGSYSLGNNSYQWSSVYAQTYYYNGTAWGLDKENVWSDINIFTNVIAYKDTVAEIGNYPTSNRIKYQTFADKNGTTLGYTNFAVATNGVTSWNLWLENKATNGALSPTGTQVKSFMGLYIDTDMSSKLKLYGDFIPNNTNRFDLGTSTNKWKTLNGINPGALSLPDTSDSVVVDTTDWVYDGLTANLIKFNNAVQTFSGWLYITAQNTSANDRIVVRYISSDASNLTFIGGKFDGATSIFVACPIVAGVSTYVWSTKALNTIKIYKALGNV